MNEAAVGPPGVMPIQQPIAALRSSASQYRGRPPSARNTSRQSIREETARACNSSSTAIRSSPMPNRPMTATTKLTPFTSSSMPMVRRTLPETVSMPMAAMAKPIAMRDHRLHRRRAAHADEAREGQEIDGEIFGRTEGERDLRDPRGEEGDQHDADQRAEGRRAEGGGERRGRPSVARHRIAVEGRRDRRRLAREC